MTTGPETDFRRLPLAAMKAAVARFEEQVDDAQRASPPSKDKVKRALHREGTGWCPVRIKRLSHDVIIRYGDALAGLFSRMPDDVIAIFPYEATIGYQAPDKGPRIDAVEALMGEAQWTDEWGTRWGHAFGGVGATPVDCALKEWDQLDAYLARHMPDPRVPGRLNAALPVLEEHGRTKYCIGIINLALFERLHCLRGMQNVFADFYTNEREVRRLLDALCGYLVELVRRWAEIGADAVLLTDDWGTQTGLMISPVMWRDFFKAHYRNVFGEAHRGGLDVIFHSCGNVTDIVGDLIEVGLDVLDPLQPGAMDMLRVAREFGGRVSFSGAVDVQHLLVHGSPQQIAEEVRRTMDALGRPYGGGLIVAPANVLTPEVPLENLEALFTACHEPA